MGVIKEDYALYFLILCLKAVYTILHLQEQLYLN